MGKPVTSQQSEYLIRTFYRFVKIPKEKLAPLRDELHLAGVELNIKGSLLLAEEGCNATISGSAPDVEAFFGEVQRHFPGMRGQDTSATVNPFQFWKVPLKRQIVQARDSDISPTKNFEGQSDPEHWDQVRTMVLAGGAQMIDVRNSYEIAIGTFPEAIDPSTNTFKEFSDYLDREVGATLDPQLPTAIFCTGGIRCEKARVDLERRGFENVVQLKGGIIGYLRDSKEAGFQGECFVFDERVAVDTELNPSESYRLCKICRGPIPIGGGTHDCNNGRRKPE